MKTYEQSEIITNGQYTEVAIHRPNTPIEVKLMLAVNMKKAIPCKYQCDLYNHFYEKCTGHCLRWRNSADIVFKEVKEPQCDYTVIETEFAKNCRECPPLLAQFQESTEEEQTN